MPRFPFSGRCMSCLIVAYLLTGVVAAEAEPALHERIDEFITAGMPRSANQVAPQAADAEFLRRVYLDLTGTIPTASEARTFLADASPGKRCQLIDRLLASPNYAN